MRSISEFNEAKVFHYDFRESRLIKAAVMIERLTPGRMLDIGCSTGGWLLHWRSRGWEPSGIDIDAEDVAAAAAKGIDARTCDLNADPLPFPDETFDLVFAGEVIEHLIDTDGFLREVNRCLRPGGHLIVTTPNLASFENRLRLLLGIYPIWVNYNLDGSGHVRAYTPRILKKQLRDFGFDPIRQSGNWVPFLPQRFTDDIRMPALAITGTLLPNLAMGIIVLARKTESLPGQEQKSD